MRKLAVVLLSMCAIGCADLARPTTEDPIEPPRIAPAAESASGDEVVPEPGEVGGGCGTPSSAPGGMSVATADGVSSDGIGDSPDDGSVEALSRLGEACLGACFTIQGWGCVGAGEICAGSIVVTVGGAAIPCGVAVAIGCGALLTSGFSCMAICPL